MKNKLPLLLFSVLGATAFTCAFADSGKELLFSAPIQQMDRTIGTVTLLGQTFQTTADQLAIGQVVNVYGVLNKDGSISEAIVQATSAYGANGDPVFVKGVVTNADSILGRVEVDGMSIDYTSQLSKPGFNPPSAGDVIEIAASQPAQKGTLIAVATGSDAYSAGFSSGGTQFAGGVATVANSGATGTTVAGMTGGGSATAGMTGGGSATAGMTGGGSATAGMTGGGSATAGMTGGGSATAGMTGGGSATAGMTGGGSATAGMTGGGSATAGMTGGGSATAGMTGGGSATAGMTGGGSATAGMTGGGSATAGMTGGGSATAGMTGGGTFTAGMTGGGR